MDIKIAITKDGYKTLTFDYTLPPIQSDELLSSPERERLMSAAIRTDPLRRGEFDERLKKRERIVRMLTDDVARSVIAYLEANEFKPEVKKGAA